MAEDEENISDFVSRGLRNFNYEVTVAADGDEAWRLLEKENNFDLVMLDIRMPGLSGLEVCRHIRDAFGFRTPVLMLTALGTTNDIVDGLHAGADDYIVKPFMFMELMARIEALLRRSGANTERVMTCGDLKLDIASHQALRGDRTIDLSIKELRLLQYMMEHEGEELSRRQLLKIWSWLLPAVEFSFNRDSCCLRYRQA